MKAKCLAVVLVAMAVALGVSCGGASNSTSAANNFVPANATPSKTPADAVSQTVTIDSPDGVKLAGTLLFAEKPNSPAVLLLHQWQSDRHSYDDFAKQMQAKGFNVLAIDGRGFGESLKAADGKVISAERTDAAVKGMLGDVSAAFDFLARQKNVDPARIAIVGASYGSSLALIYAADNPKVRSVAMLSPGLNYFGNMPTEPAVKKYGARPLLLVAASDDQESAGSVMKLKVVVPDEKYEIRIFEKGGHGTGLFKAKVGLEDTLEAFLTKTV